MTPETDVAAAQSFDVTSFLNNLVTVGGNIAAASINPTQSNGQPATTLTPQIRVGANGTQNVTAGGLSQNQMLLLGALALGVVVIVALRK